MIQSEILEAQSLSWKRTTLQSSAEHQKHLSTPVTLHEQKQYKAHKSSQMLIHTKMTLLYRHNCGRCIVNSDCALTGLSVFGRLLKTFKKNDATAVYLNKTNTVSWIRLITEVIPVSCIRYKIQSPYTPWQYTCSHNRRKHCVVTLIKQKSNN